jgi:hypothetical protein
VLKDDFDDSTLVTASAPLTLDQNKQSVAKQQLLLILLSDQPMATSALLLMVLVGLLSLRSSLPCAGVEKGGETSKDVWSSILWQAKTWSALHSPFPSSARCRHSGPTPYYANSAHLAHPGDSQI